MKPELVYKSTECTYEPLVYERNVNELFERFASKVFIPITISRVEFKNGRYFYQPSEKWIRYVARMKRIA